MGKSIVAAIKAEQGWTMNAPKCANCVHYSSDIVEVIQQFGGYLTEKNIRCILGGFSTKKSAWCKKHALRG